MHHAESVMDNISTVSEASCLITSISCTRTDKVIIKI